MSPPTRVDAGILERLDRYVPLAPLHQPHNLAAVRLMLERLPGVPEIACFDTAFHRNNPELAQIFALPYELHEAGIRRYGFHGLSYEYIASALPAVDAKAAQGRTVVLHLGNGASMCALQAGRSVASTMGFTAVDGLPMGTRTGNLDPGVVLYLMDERGMDARAVEKLLYQPSGLLGVSGIASDMRTLLASRLARAADVSDLIKLEVLGDEKTLFPDTAGLIESAKILIKEGFIVLPYTNDDPIVAKKLVDIGCPAVMPLAAPIGSGLGIRNPYNLKILMESVSVPVIVDAGVGTASDAALAMEYGADAVLMNTAIAGAQDPLAMAEAMKYAVWAGRLAYKAGRIPRKLYATASSPIEGML